MNVNDVANNFLDPEALDYSHLELINCSPFPTK